jgi:galactonate dehydratase
MRVTSVDTFQVAPRWLFVKIGADDGVTGWGEAACQVADEQ